ncbi:MAG: UDP-glucose 4-epimerase GalE [Alphaproteobacteria bacterium]|nr:UDP-glucose 4-epimerase GalE [Alphaproteobacteria bacterium]
MNANNKIIVTGGCGYIGSHTCVALQQAGFNVVIIDNLVNSNIGVLEGITNITGIRPIFEQVDCADFDALHKVFAQHSDAIGVIHFAALKAVGESVEKPLLYYRNNLTALMNVLDAMTEFNIPNLVFSSSATVYGDSKILPVVEDMPTGSATCPYGQTKIMGEAIITDTIHACPTLGATLLRYFNPIGAHPSAEIGELPNGVPNNLLPYITQTAAGIRDVLNVFGDDYPTPDGYCVRDYIDVNDLAAAHVAALRHMIDAPRGVEIFNLGTGHGLSVMEIITAFEQATGQKVNWRIAPRRAGDIPAVWADVSRAARILGWKSTTPLDETLRNTWRWQQKHSKK